MINIEQMIHEVEKRECLWNISDKSHNNKNHKQKVWREVAAACFKEWNVWTNEEQQDKVLSLQTKWKSIRDYYVREKKRENEDGQIFRKKINPYFAYMTFLDANRQPRSENVLYEELEEDIFNGDSDEIEEKYHVELKTPPSPEIVVMPSVRTEPGAGCPQSPMHKKQRISHPLQYDEDPNRYFLLSFLPEMARMSERENFEFRMEMMKALDKVKYQVCNKNADSSQQSTSSTSHK